MPAAALLATTLLAGGCGSSSSKDATTTAPKVLPQAASADEWASRVVNRVLRPLNKDLVVVSNFNTPTVRVYIASKNQQTLDIINKRLGDLAAVLDEARRDRAAARRLGKARARSMTT